MNSIHERAQALTGWLLAQLTSLRHSSGKPVVRLYRPYSLARRGGTLAVNLFSPSGPFVEYPGLQKLFGDHGVSLRYGCFCNPGAFEAATGLTSLRHSNSQPVITLYGPGTTECRGGTLAVNFFSPKARFVDHSVLQAACTAAGISLRCAAFSKPP